MNKKILEKSIQQASDFFFFFPFQLVKLVHSLFAWFQWGENRKKIEGKTLVEFSLGVFFEQKKKKNSLKKKK